MSPAYSFFKFVTKAALGCVGLGVAGDFFGEFLPEIASEVYRRWGAGRPQDQLRAEVVALASVSDDEAHRLAVQAVTEEAAGQPEVVQLALLRYLTQLPAAARRTQLIPGGAAVLFSRPADLLALLPRPARFQKGQRAGLPRLGAGNPARRGRFWGGVEGPQSPPPTGGPEVLP